MNQNQFNQIWYQSHIKYKAETIKDSAIYKVPNQKHLCTKLFDVAVIWVVIGIACNQTVKWKCKANYREK